MRQSVRQASNDDSGKQTDALKLHDWQAMMKRIHSAAIGDMPSKEADRILERRQAEEELLARAMDKVGRAIEARKAVVS